ncbi:hypothetical protein C8Q80DRAFT_673244 [Daedaleopsis nitida]|nr:hypothetical protein C8Q80DRAFT_673244 [Daedaleopsis nitida]
MSGAVGERTAQTDDLYRFPSWMGENPTPRCGSDIDPSFKAPAWLVEHPAVRATGISELPRTMKPQVVFGTHRKQDIPPWVIKIIPPGSPEIEIYEHLLSNDLSSPNHTLPVEIVRDEPPLLIMPGCDQTGDIRCFGGTLLREAVDDFYQIVEGIEYLHRHRIVHMDFALDNTAIATKATVEHHKHLEVNKIYIIDFGFSRRFELGPRAQNPVDLGHLNLSVRYGVPRLDPYSWDVLCMGNALLFLLDMLNGSNGKHPWICTRYAQWLVGKEQGCPGVCHCRPTARRALQVLAIIRWFVHGWDACASAFGYIVGLNGFRRH